MGSRTAQLAGYHTEPLVWIWAERVPISGLSVEGRPRRSSELSIEWEGTLGFSGVDVVSIVGPAEGPLPGSTRWEDCTSGPRAGADPGPASYGAGGTSPILTDAYLLLGYLGSEPIIGVTASK